jgi:hypothetical protein
MLQWAGIVVELAPDATRRLGHALDWVTLELFRLPTARLQQLLDARGNLRCLAILHRVLLLIPIDWSVVIHVR